VCYLDKENNRKKVNTYFITFKITIIYLNYVKNWWTWIIIKIKKLLKMILVKVHDTVSSAVSKISCAWSTWCAPCQKSSPRSTPCGRMKIKIWPGSGQPGSFSVCADSVGYGGVAGPCINSSFVNIYIKINKKFLETNDNKI
jgi:hypothetical protein